MDHMEEAATSEHIATMLNTNPVVVRRTMGCLREQGYVTSVKGHGGGWRLNVALKDITLLDIHNALGESSVFTIGLSDEYTECPIEKAVNREIGDALKASEDFLLTRFGEVTLDKLTLAKA
jgi:DNA-binding IscR family transcriptional regulator